jgi:hypothetical protein
LKERGSEGLVAKDGESAYRGGPTHSHDFRLSRGVTWLEPTRDVELTYGKIMEGRLRDPVWAP